MFQSSFRSLLKSPLSLRKSKYFGEASLFNLHYLYLNYHILAQKLFSLWKILPLLQPSTKSFGFFLERISLSLRKKSVIHQPKSARVGKNCALSLEYGFPQYRPSSWRITVYFSVLQQIHAPYIHFRTSIHSFNGILKKTTVKNHL